MAIGEIVTAGLGFLGNLFGRKKTPEKQVIENRVDYGRMVADAEAAGFNPLTALRNGGAAGYSVSTQSHPGLSSSSDFLGDAFSSLARAIPAYQDARVAEAQQESEAKLVEAQLKNIEADTRLKLRSLDVPTMTGFNVRHGGAELATVGMEPPPLEVKAATVTNPYPWWTGLVPYPGNPDADAMETRHGDIAGNLGGIVNFPSDVVYSAGRWAESGYNAALKLRDKLREHADEPATPSEYDKRRYESQRVRFGLPPKAGY